MNFLHLQRIWRMGTSPRMFPSFMIIGGRRCGSSSLFNYLSEHPRTASSSRKEIHFFDTKFHKGLKWYRSHFPTNFYKSLYQSKHKKNLLAYEASPYYLTHPIAPKRISNILPNIKIIVLLRNPVERAFSDWKHAGQETLTFEEALKQESQKIDGEEERIIENPNYISLTHWRRAYRYQGNYKKFLKRWFDYFPKEQFHIIKSEDLYHNTSSVMNDVYKFLNIESFELEKYDRFNFTDDKIKMNIDTRKKLIEFFKPLNQELYDFLDLDFNWK